MSLHIAMLIAGTIPICGYWILQKLYGDGIETKWKIYILRLSIILFLCPFQKLKYLLPYNIFKWVSIGNYQNFSKIKLPSVSIPVGKGNYEIWSIPLLVVTLILWAGAIGIIVKKYRDYFQIRRRINNELIQVEYIEEKNKKVPVYEEKETLTPCTLGWIRPIILMPEKEYTKKERKWILQHEMTHIRHRDLFWKQLCIICCAIYWYYPIAYYLLFTYDFLCEYYCDEVCMKDEDKQERRTYAKFLVEASCFPEENKLAFAQGLTKGGKQLKRRIDNFLKRQDEKEKHKDKKGKIAVLIMTISVLFSGISAFAYTIPIEQNYKESADIMTGEEWEELYGKDDEADDKLDFSESPFLFIDEDGNITALKENNTETYSACKHSYKSGTTKKHILLKNGGCWVETHKAKICRKCENTIMEKEVIQKTYLAKCIHKK